MLPKPFRIKTQFLEWRTFATHLALTNMMQGRFLNVIIGMVSKITLLTHFLIPPQQQLFANVMTLTTKFNRSLQDCGQDIDLLIKVADGELHWSLKLEHLYKWGAGLILGNMRNPFGSRVCGKTSYLFVC